VESGPILYIGSPSTLSYSY